MMDRAVPQPFEDGRIQLGGVKFGDASQRGGGHETVGDDAQLGVGFREPTTTSQSPDTLQGFFAGERDCLRQSRLPQGSERIG